MGLALGTQNSRFSLANVDRFGQSRHRRNRREPLAWISHTIERIGGLTLDRPLTVKLFKMTARMLKREERSEREYHEQPR